MHFRLIIAAVVATWGLVAFAAKPVYLQNTTLDQAPSDFSVSEVSKNFIVQFEKTITENDKTQLKKMGYQVVSYVPQDALIVRSKQPVATTELKSLKGVEAVWDFQSEWKKSDALPAASIFNANQAVGLLLKTFEAQSVEPIIRGQVLQSSGEYHQVMVSISELPHILNHQDIQWVEALPEMTPMVLDVNGFAENGTADYENITGYETGTRVMKFEAAWDRGLHGEGQAVAMADTGLDRGVVGTLTDDFSTVTRGYKFGLFAKDWSDPMGHGTHVAGSVMSQGTISEGRFRGGAYGAEMIPQGMWSPVLKNLSVPAQLGDMLAPAFGDGARVHTNSWGSPQDPGKYHSYSRQVDQFMWDHPEMLVVFAAGNSGVDADRDGRIDPGSVSFPGTAKNVLTVGASENYLLEGGIQRKLGELKGGEPWGAEPIASDTLSNNENGIAAFSSRGPTLDGRMKPDVVAPGTNIVSNCSPVDGASELWGHYNDAYCYSGGTSMATPLTAGAAAVTRQFLIENMSISNPSAALVKAVMMNSADNLYPGQFGAIGKSAGQELLIDGPNNHQGFGRVNMDRGTDPSRFAQLVDETTGVAAGETKRYEVALGEVSDFKVTLVYTDAPASENAARALVNDIDLKVSINGTQRVSESRIDNVEQIRVGQVSGTAVIEVSGINVPMGKDGKQPFALVISK